MRTSPAKRFCNDVLFYNRIIKSEPGIQVATYLDTEGIALFNAVKAKALCLK